MSVRAKSAKPRRLLVQSRTPQKSFVLLLEEKIGRPQIKKMQTKLFCGAASDSEPPAGRISSAQNGFTQSLELSAKIRLPDFFAEDINFNDRKNSSSLYLFYMEILV